MGDYKINFLGRKLLVHVDEELIAEETRRATLYAKTKFKIKPFRVRLL